MEFNFVLHIPNKTVHEAAGQCLLFEMSKFEISAYKRNSVFNVRIFFQICPEKYREMFEKEEFTWPSELKLVSMNFKYHFYICTMNTK